MICLTLLPNIPKIASKNNFDSPHILICEDDKDVALLISMMLKDEQYTCDIAYTAQQAKQLLSENDYDALTLDLILPDQDGISLIKELRQNKKTENMPIIVVSVRAEEGSQELESHFAILDWINKPIEEDKLRTALKRVGITDNLVMPKILHIEDDLDVQKIIHSILKDDATISQVTNLADAKNMLEKNNFDLVLLDLELPDGSGAELLPLLNKDKKMLTVIFSAHNVDEDLANQVDAVLLKSKVSNDDLFDIINLIKLRKVN